MTKGPKARRYRVWLVSAWLAFATVAANAAGPFTLTEVLQALKSGKPKQTELVRQVSSRHVSFRLTPSVRAELKTAGATSALLQAIEFNPELDKGNTVPESAGANAGGAGTASSAAAGTAQDVPTYTSEAIVEAPEGPVTQAEVEGALPRRDDQNNLLATLPDRGVSFQYTPELGRSWQAKGATPELLAAIATATVTRAAPPEDFVALPVAKAKDYDEKGPMGRFDVRVQVDAAVEVRIHGSEAIWARLQGTEGKDAGTETNQPFPMRPVRNLTVTKKDGRGQFVLIQQPDAANGYELRVRIYDPKGGSDRYHLRIEWQN